MKILYLVDPQQDYLTSMIFEGLCSLIGDKNMFVYPMLKRWKYGEVDDWYILPDGKRGRTGVVAYEPTRPDLPELNLDEICNRINEFDYIIFASPREYTVKSFRAIREKCGVLTNKIIFMDGEDGPNVQEELLEEIQPHCIFKREIFYDAHFKGKKIYPLPFAAFTHKVPKFEDAKKELNCFGIFGNTNNLRVKMVREFNNFGISDSIVDIDTGVSDWDRNQPRHGKMGYNDYMHNISLSKIGLSCRGHGRDCVRYLEVPSYETMLMCIDPKIVIPFPFKDRYNCVIIKDDLSNFKELLEYYLSHDKEREEIAYNGHQHLLKYHTCEKRALYMLNIAEGNI